ncbi:MAG: type II CRISPR-associated endonuclease Cas1 [Gammaproteobacteria bacterium]|nr:type II CRISPR-associated endonuclease Cas1 [Gammaproteobacteria bacterium]
MLGRIVEVADDNRYLSLHRGFMVVLATDGEREQLGKVPLDDIAAVIGNAYGLSYSNNLLVALAERGAPFVLCAANHNAVGMLLPIDGNYHQAKRFDAQLGAKRPLQKRLWAQLVRSKLLAQASVLETFDSPSAALTRLASKVRSGDAENLEAQGARYYWPLLFGAAFKRDQGAAGLNSLLNYGYTVFRAAMARAVVSAGLHPTLGLHHSNEGNPMRLVDDLIEPFRPRVDLCVRRLLDSGCDEVVPESKRALVQALYEDVATVTGVSPVTVCMQRLAQSLVQIYLGERAELELPSMQSVAERSAAAG